MKVVLLSLFVLVSAAKASSVLMVLPLGSRSHKNIFVPLAETLAANGHAVTIYSMHGSPNGSSSLSYKDVVADKAWKTVQKATGEFNIFKMIEKSGSKNVNSQVMKTVVKNLPEYCEAFLNDPSAQEALHDKPDLILLPAFMNECGLILVHKFKVPFIYVTTSGLTPWTADLVGTPEHPAYVPNQYLPYSDHMTLWERTVNSVFRAAAPALRSHFVMNKLNSVAQKYLQDSTVSLQEVEKNVSLVLVNSHHSMGFPRPLQPNVIEVGGMHCHDPSPIQDQELNSFLNSSADNSVILFSLGSHLKSSQMPASFRKMLVRVFSKLPFNVVWKWEGAPLQDLPSNILQKKWLPQQDLLGHRAVGGFLTHGGLLSTQEAIYHGVPLVGLPLMSDQHLNIKKAQSLGFAIDLQIDSLTETQLEDALTAIMTRPHFRENVARRSILMKDQETTPLSRATYYTQFVLRHGGAEHLKSAASSLSLVQFYLVDVFLVLICCLIALLTVIAVGFYVVAALVKKGVRKVAHVSITFLRKHFKVE